MAEGFAALIDPPPVNAAHVDLRPLTTSELIDRGFALYRQHFAGFFLLALLCQVVPFGLGQAVLAAIKLIPAESGLMDRPSTDLTRALVLLLVWVLSQVVTFALEVVLTTLLGGGLSRRHAHNQKRMRRLRSCLGASIWTSLLNIVLVTVPLLFPLIVSAVIYVYSQLHPPQDFIGVLLFLAMALVLFVASLAPVLIVVMRLMVTLPAVALERLSGWPAVKRSSTLVRFDPGLGVLYWGEMRLSFLLLPLFVIELLAFSVTSLPMTLHQINEILQHGAIGQIAAPPDFTVILSQILVLLTGSLLLPLYLIATTLFYYDVRIRREGFDLEFLAARAGAVT